MGSKSGGGVGAVFCLIVGVGIVITIVTGELAQWIPMCIGLAVGVMTVNIIRGK